MKSVSRVLLVKAILFLMTTGVAAQTIANAYVSGTALLDNGSSADVNVFRSQDPASGLITTTLFYNSCPASSNVGCQQGTGVIPNSAFKGSVNLKNFTRYDQLTLSVDTNAVSGFHNYICINDHAFYCAIQSPTSGGIISMSWTRTNAYANLTSSMEKDYQFSKLVVAQSSTLAEFSANPAGAFFASQVTGAISVNMGTSQNSQTLKTKFAALKSK